MHRLDNAATALHAINAVQTAQGRPPLDADEINDETIADLIANLLHLAARAGIDPDDVHAHGWDYFTGDAEEEDHARLVGGAEGFHGTPAVLAPGTVLVPGPHLHHVYAATEDVLAVMWGNVRARATGAPVHVYRVRFGDDAEESEGHVYGTTATVLELVEGIPDTCDSPDCRRAAATPDEADEVPEGPHGRCDTCGARCNENGCTTDPTHAVALEPF